NNKAQGGRGTFDDSDDEVYATAKRIDQENDYDESQADGKKAMEVLAPVDHSTIQYESFRKNFYTVHADVKAMTLQDVQALQKELSVRTEGFDVPSPIRSFVHLGFDRKMLALLMKLGLEAPTAIQAQSFPVALSGRDMVGIAKTGSGKTLAFTLPMVQHVMDQRELRKDEGPIAVVLAPTRELAHQIFTHAKRFLHLYGAECAAIYGGVGKWEQIQAVRKGAEVIVATPGRLIEMIRKKTVKMNRVTFVVLDEADRMFEMGFEPQLRSIMGQIRPDRQTLMFSATFRRRIEALAFDILDNPVKVMIGKIGQANEDIHQIAVVVPNDNAKWPWLMSNLKGIVADGRVLIFAGSKLGCEELTKNLNAMQFPSWCLHGDKTQQERSEALSKFKSGECLILVATDVASRGLDIKDVKTVVNFDTAKNIDIHVHRIGRTGRMGLDGFEPGTAYTLVTPRESQFASQLVYNMDVSGQTVGPDLLSLAKRDPRFRRGTPAVAAKATSKRKYPSRSAKPS
uniref:RNA helicase n=1 Tax=Globisporangium ultimum (strain ATCC 200006 / CBS 805.95 / DAOM BR144) TaxID=431595 RepID=K3WM87_GLOUD